LGIRRDQFIGLTGRHLPGLEGHTPQKYLLRTWIKNDLQPLVEFYRDRHGRFR
jgi:hypothetical protein